MTFTLGDRPTKTQRALMQSMAIEYERTMERLGHALDRIAPDGIDSPEWLAMVNHALGEDVTEWYAEWIGEVWEPTSSDAGGES